MCIINVHIFSSLSEDVLEGIAVASTELFRQISAQFEEEGFATVLLGPLSPLLESTYTSGSEQGGGGSSGNGRSEMVVTGLLPLDRADRGYPENDDEERSCR